MCGFWWGFGVGFVLGVAVLHFSEVYWDKQRTTADSANAWLQSQDFQFARDNESENS